MDTKYIPKKGDFFTIVKWFPRNGHEDRSWCGACLEALAVDGPLVRVREHPYPSSGSFTVSAEECQFRPLSKEFVEAVCTNRK